MARKLVTALGLGAVAGAGYYLYAAGGDPKVASKIAEHDASKASAKVKSELPGSNKETQKQGEEWAQRAGSKLDSTVADAKAKGKEYDSKIGKLGSDAESRLAQLKSEAGGKFDEVRKDTNKTIDDLDKTVERKASEAKSGISSWFGGSK